MKLDLFRKRSKWSLSARGAGPLRHRYGWVPVIGFLASLIVLPLTAQDAPGDARARAKAVRDYGKQGGSAIIPKLATYLSDPDLDVRVEAVKAIVDLDTVQSGPSDQGPRGHRS